MKLAEASLDQVLHFYNGKAAHTKEIGTFCVYGSNGTIGFADEFNHDAAIILGRVGAYCGSVAVSDDKFWATDNTIVVKTKSEQSLHYWYYHLKMLSLNSYAGGAAQPLLTQGILKGIKTKYHSDIHQQTAIASTLSAYDDLIENNNRRIRLLEEAARLLYQEWFVRLRFPGYEHTRIVNGVPEGWEKVLLEEHVLLNYGKSLKADDRIEGPFPVYGSSGVIGAHEKALAQGPGIIVGRKGNVGSVYWCSKDFYPIDTVYFIDSEASNLYLYYALKHMHFISTDVAVPGLNRDFAYSRTLILPSKQLLCSFLDVVTYFYEQIDKLDEMNQKLKAARDLLLPRLMNGDIPV